MWGGLYFGRSYRGALSSVAAQAGLATSASSSSAGGALTAATRVGAAASNGVSTALGTTTVATALTLSPSGGTSTAAGTVVPGIVTNPSVSSSNTQPLVLVTVQKLVLATSASMSAAANVVNTVSPVAGLSASTSAASIKVNAPTRPGIAASNATSTATGALYALSLLKSAYRDTILADTPNAYWRLNDPPYSGTVYDLIGSNPGVYFGSQTPNLVTNPSFESNVTGWTPFLGTITQSSAQHFKGAFSALLSATTGTTGIYQEISMTSANIPVTQGLSYILSASCYVTASPQAPNIYLRWLDSGGARISQTSVTGTATQNAWQTITLAPQVAPAGAVNAQLVLLVYSGTPVVAVTASAYWDAVQLTAENRVANFSFASGVGSPWQYVNCSGVQSAAQVYGSATSNQVTSSGVAYSLRQNVPVVANQTHTLTTWIYASNVARVIGGNAAIVWKNAAGTAVGTTGTWAGGSAVLGAWTQFTCTATAPATAVTADIYGLYVNGGAPGDVFYVDNVQFYRATEAYSDTQGLTLGFNSLLSSGDADTSVASDGVSGYAVVPYSAATNPTLFSYEAWIRTPAVLGSNNSTIFSNREFGVRGFLLFSNGSQLNLSIYNGTSSPVSNTHPSILNVNTTYHVVLTYDGTNANVYINGTLYTSTPVAYVPPLAQPLGIGADGNGGLYQFQGALDEAAVYGYALTPRQVLAHYWTGIGRMVSASTSTTSLSVIGIPRVSGGAAGTSADSLRFFFYKNPTQIAVVAAANEDVVAQTAGTIDVPVNST